MEQAEQQEPVLKEDDKSLLKVLIARGKEQGFLTYAEVNDHLPNDIVEPEQIEDIVNMINDMGITVHESPPDLEGQITDNTNAPDEDAAAEAAAALANLENEFGRTTDPVRMYMREMGTVDLLTREGEIRIAKRIEEGLGQVLSALSSYPGTIKTLLNAYDMILKEEMKLSDVIVGFNDTSHYPDEGIQVVNPTQIQESDDDSDEDVDDDDDEDSTERRGSCCFKPLKMSKSILKSSKSFIRNTSNLLSATVRKTTKPRFMKKNWQTSSLN